MTSVGVRMVILVNGLRDIVLRNRGLVDAMDEYVALHGGDDGVNGLLWAILKEKPLDPGLRKHQTTVLHFVEHHAWPLRKVLAGLVALPAGDISHTVQISRHILTECEPFALKCEWKP